MSNRIEYTLQQFQAQYQLTSADAFRLFTKFGPGKVNLDLLMKGKMERGTRSADSVQEVRAKRAYRMIGRRPKVEQRDQHL